MDGNKLKLLKTKNMTKRRFKVNKLKKLKPNASKSTLQLVDGSM